METPNDIAARDNEAIMRRLVGVEFTWDYERSMVDLVFMKGLAAPRIAGLISAQKYIQAFPQKRYDDTAIMMFEFVKHGHSSERGRQVIARLNEVHSRFKIRQDDYLYVLTGLMLEPVRWNARFGWRKFTETEKLANFHFWRQVGLRMDLTIVPDTYEACEEFNVEYESAELRRTKASVELANILIRLIESWLPLPARPFVRPGLATLVDDVLLSYFDMARPPRWMSWFVPRALRLRARVLAWLPERRRAQFYVDRRLRSYPHGYEVHELGPQVTPTEATTIAAQAHAERAAMSSDEHRGAVERDSKYCQHEGARGARSAAAPSS